jgi:hypothetical protein
VAAGGRRSACSRRYVRSSTHRLIAGPLSERGLRSCAACRRA